MTLEFQAVDVKKLLTVLAHELDYNIMIDDAVKGDVSLYLKDVSWQQALNAILRMKNLKAETDNNILFISPETDEIAGFKPELLRLRFAQADKIAELVKQTSGLLSADGSLVVDPRTNQLWAQDDRTHLLKLRQFIAALDVPVKQIRITGRIVNVDRNYLNRLGVKFTSSNQNQTGTDNTNTGNNINLSTNEARITLARFGSTSTLDAEIAALEAEGHGKLISHPKLLTANGVAAYIEAGQEIPYQEKTSSGATNVAFKKAVLGLKVTPEITNRNQIQLLLSLNQDKVSRITVNGVPAIETQQIQTQVLAQNNQTIVLGGIYEQSAQNREERVPVLGKIPLVGGLFKQREKENNTRELLIFITPEIVD